MNTEYDILRNRLNQKGYALPMVIAISMIIILMTLSIAISMRQRIAVISELRDQSIARLKSYSGFNEAMYNILTSNFTSTGIKIYLPDAKWKIWNLYGDRIYLDDSVSVQLQDIAGMISPLTQPQYLAALLSRASVSTSDVTSFLDKLADWQEPGELKRLNGAKAWDYLAAGYSYTPRNYYIQTIDEIRLLKDFDDSPLDAFRENLVYWGSDYVNYLTMSEKLLRALLKNDRTVTDLLEMRRNQVLTGDYFTALTGIQPTDSVRMGPCGMIQVTVTAREHSAVDEIKAVIIKRELHEKPFTILEWKR